MLVAARNHRHLYSLAGRGSGGGPVGSWAPFWTRAWWPLIGGRLEVADGDRLPPFRTANGTTASTEHQQHRQQAQGHRQSQTSTYRT